MILFLLEMKVSFYNGFLSVVNVVDALIVLPPDGQERTSGL